ncbi:hypothetical protein ACVBEH_17660 [Roseateles sp. GG27B]
MKRGHRQPADDATIDSDGALDALRRGQLEAGHALPLRVEQGEAARRPGQLRDGRRRPTGRNHGGVDAAVVRQRPQQAVPEVGLAGQEGPVPVLPVTGRHSGHGGVESQQRLLIQIAEKAAHQVDMSGHAHGQRDHHGGGQNGGKQFGGDAQFHARRAAMKPLFF